MKIKRSTVFMLILSLSMLSLPANAYRLSDLDAPTTSPPTAPVMLADAALPLAPAIIPPLPAQIIPAAIPVVKCLSDSTVTTLQVNYRAKRTDPIKHMEGTHKQYRYLLEGGGSIYSDVKLKKVRDVRPEIKKHPVGQRRFLWAQAEAKAWAPILAVGEGLVACLALFVNTRSN